MEAETDFAGNASKRIIWLSAQGILTQKALKFHNIQHLLVKMKYTSWMIHEMFYSSHAASKFRA